LTSGSSAARRPDTWKPPGHFEQARHVEADGTAVCDTRNVDTVGSFGPGEVTGNVVLTIDGGQ
jgi:hypothetical protein